jgi:hypothetical protein
MSLATAWSVEVLVVSCLGNDLGNTLVSLNLDS